MNPIKFSVIIVLRLYRAVVSPMKSVLFPEMGRCRYTPSCSQYALEAVQSHGVGHGSWLAAKRLCRCHPWGGFGPDPVPPRFS